LTVKLLALTMWAEYATRAHVLFLYFRKRKTYPKR